MKAFLASQQEETKRKKHQEKIKEIDEAKKLFYPSELSEKKVRSLIIGDALDA